MTEELLEDSPADQWVPDLLDGCSRMTLPLEEDEEGPVSATLVRYDRHRDSGAASQVGSDAGPDTAAELAPETAPDAAPEAGHAGGGERGQHRCPVAAPILHLHGWSDYFFNLPMARYWESLGRPFYALDLRKYGRSLRWWQTPGYIEDLSTYDQEINAALEAVSADIGGRFGRHSPPPVVQGHSTGGLIAALWAQRHPQRPGALVLNSPWLEMPGDLPARAAVEGLVTPMNRLQPKRPMKLPVMDTYWQSLSAEARGEWSLHPKWRPRISFPTRPGWLKAVVAGHREVYEGLDLEIPVLVVLSAETRYRRSWAEELQRSDSVLDVELLARRAVRLGSSVTVVRLDEAMHDVFASAHEVRQTAFAEVARWLRAYAPEES